MLLYVLISYSDPTWELCRGVASAKAGRRRGRGGVAETGIACSGGGGKVLEVLLSRLILLKVAVVIDFL